jgi:alkanesulfonate monooxygenase SsuD/methylene tetrahydromethanopterin reductase-like flavin-dependent oxidoreductase (luciferase family)
LTGAVAASSAHVQVGTWVISALQHNPGMVARAAETLDEISNGRFVLGLGSGHARGGAKEYGYPDGKIVSRYAEALEIIVPLLRGQSATFHGEFHHADGAEVLPRGPRPGKIPLMLGGHAPRTMTLAATHADIWSAYATTSSWPEAFAPMIEQLERICEGIGRDPATLGRSVGIDVEPGEPRMAETSERSGAIGGSVEQIAETLASFADIGVTRIEIVPSSGTMDELEQLGAALAALR